jgi:hypothetical protein
VLHTADAATAAAAARLATSVNTSVNTSAVGSVAADTATTAASAATAASTATDHTACVGGGAVDSNNMLESSNNTGCSTRECSDSDMSLDAVEEMLDAAIADNGKSHIYACRHCASVSSTVVSSHRLILYTVQTFKLASATVSV